MRDDVLVPLSDSSLLGYRKEGDDLVVDITLWNETVRSIRAIGVDYLEDDNTWEVDALVFVPDLDRGESHGYGIVDTDERVTMRFRARRVDTS